MARSSSQVAHCLNFAAFGLASATLTLIRALGVKPFAWALLTAVSRT